MSCRTEARVERNTARASPFSTCVPRAATATRLLNRVLGVYGFCGFRRESKITREVDHKRRSRKALQGSRGQLSLTRNARCSLVRKSGTAISANQGNADLASIWILLRRLKPNQQISSLCPK